MNDQQRLQSELHHVNHMIEMVRQFQDTMQEREDTDDLDHWTTIQVQAVHTILTAFHDTLVNIRTFLLTFHVEP